MMIEVKTDEIIEGPFIKHPRSIITLEKSRGKYVVRTYEIKPRNETLPTANQKEALTHYKAIIK